MERLGTLQGIGTLAMGNERFEGVNYRIDVWLHSRGAKSGKGVLEGNSDALYAAFDSDEVTLILQNGDSVNLIVFLISGGHAEVKTNGPVPEY